MALGAVFALTSAPARADMIDTEGMQPWEVCALCHSLDGVSRMARFPKLAGQRPGYILKQIGDIRAGRRDNDGGQMQAVATEVAEADLPAIAEWFASQPAPPAAEPEGDAAAGAALFVDKGCGRCHGAQPPEGLTPPLLTAQHEAYLEKQLLDFRDGRRENDPDGVMRAMASELADAEIAALAAYLASTPRE